MIQFSANAQEYYKLYFAAEGIYKVTGQELADAGIPISQIQPQTIQLFSDGQNILPYSTAEPEPQLQEVAILVEDGGDGQFDPQDYLQFYGQSLHRFEWDADAGDYRFRSSPYDTLACYWLRWNAAPGKRSAQKNGSPVSGGAILRDTFTDRLRLEKDRFNPIKSGLIWSWNLFGQNNTFEHSFELSGVAGAEGLATARLLFLDVYYNPYPPGMISVRVNTALMGTATGNHTITAPVPIYEGANTVQAEYFPSDPADTLEQSGFDWLELLYPRYTGLAGNEMKIFIAPTSGIFHTKYRSGGDPAAIFDVTDPFNVRHIFTDNDSLFEDTLTAEHKVYWLNRENFAHSVASIQPGQRNIFSPADGADYLIITRRQTEPLMQPLKAHREAYNNFAVKIVAVEDIFEEFGFGRADPTAIRNFIKFAHANWNPQPQYVLLAGNGYYDYRNLSGEYPVNWVPAFEISGNDDISSRAVDDFYVDLSFTDEPGFPPFPQPFENDFIPGLREDHSEHGKVDDPEAISQNFNNIDPQIPIGRFPADTPEELAALAEKTIRSEVNYQPGLWRLSALLIADDEFRGPGSGNEFFHLEQSENLASNEFPSELRIYKLHEREYPFAGNEKPAATRQLINWFNLGNRIAMFYGHGNDEQWTHENLLNVQRDMVSIRNDDKLCFFGGASSLYKFDDRRGGILQNLLKREKSGLTATLTANRPAFAFQSDIFFRRFFSRLFGDAGGFAGKAVMLAKISGTDNQKRHLLGDPALNLSLPAERVHVTAITPDTLKARSLAQISGYVDNPAAGDSLLVEVREPGKIKSIPPPSFLTSYEATGGALFRGCVPLNNGQFTFQFVVSGDVPADSAAARGKLHAYIWNGLNEGMGFVNSLPVGGSVSGTGDVTPPQITLTVTGGDTVGRDAYLIAQIFDESGVNLSRFQNHYPLLFIDGNYQDTLNPGDFFYYQEGSYQSGTLRYPLPYLSAGSHTLTLKAHDTYNNAASDSISFVTGITPPPGYLPDQISLAQNYPNPFNPETAIPFSVSGSSRYRVRLEVFNLLGQKVRTLLNEIVLAGEYEARWDGRDQRGNPVASGLYIYRLRVSSHFPEVSGQRGGIYQQARKMLLIR
ncbi:MAG: C25 family cysteine peptidase [Calditrichia bacterium]|nr:C25 family cysteine peptidase [Calditrichia bacterium]